MGVVLKYMFCELMLIVGLTFAQEYDSGTNREINLLKWRMDNVNMELLDVKSDLKVEKAKTMKLEKQVNTLMEENQMTKNDDTDSDLPGHVSVEDQQQAIDKVSSAIEKRVYQAMNDEKMVRKQFQNQMQTDFKTAKVNIELRFTALNETLSAVIESKSDTTTEKLLESIAVLNEYIGSIENLTRHVQQNDGDIISLSVESDKLNTTLLEHGVLLCALNDSLVDIRASVEEQLDNSLRFKVCLHDGTHTEEGLCECPLPYFGNHCEKVCFNGGKSSDDGQCECVSPYYGTKCEKVVCFNGGNQLKNGPCECVLPYYGIQCEKAYYMDCYDIHKQTDKPTGVYEINPLGLNETFNVFCDMDTDNGGWTVFQYRYDGSVDFYRKFTDYENGFGSVTGEFWVGLSYIQVMTSAAPTQLRIDVEAADGTRRYQIYNNFYLTKGPDYALHVRTSTGTLGESDSDVSSKGLSHTNGYSFTTYDHDNDGRKGNCAVDRHGAWWYNTCTRVNLNGEYVKPGTQSTIDRGYGGMVYHNFKDNESLKSSKIMFRRI